MALVGYTNAGKSTLFNVLTGAGVLESAKMFATLDPTVRGVTLPSKRKVLLSDTVGFIRNLPTTLVSAFRATLEEVQRAALLLHVADVTSASAHDQQTQVESVLKDLEVMDRPQIRVMNKIDLVPQAQRRELKNTREHRLYLSRRRTWPGRSALRHRRPPGDRRHRSTCGFAFPKVKANCWRRLNHGRTS